MGKHSAYDTARRSTCTGLVNLIIRIISCGSLSTSRRGVCVDIRIRVRFSSVSAVQSTGKARDASQPLLQGLWLLLLQNQGSAAHMDDIAEVQSEVRKLCAGLQRCAHMNKAYLLPALRHITTLPYLRILRYCWLFRSHRCLVVRIGCRQFLIVGRCLYLRHCGIKDMMHHLFHSDAIDPFMLKEVQINFTPLGIWKQKCH